VRKWCIYQHKAGENPASGATAWLRDLAARIPGSPYLEWIAGNQK
jgi:hypothetical protein